MALCGANKSDWQIEAIKGFIDDNKKQFERWLSESGYAVAELTADEVLDYLND